MIFRPVRLSIIPHLLAHINRQKAWLLGEFLGSEGFSAV